MARCWINLESAHLKAQVFRFLICGFWNLGLDPGLPWIIYKWLFHVINDCRLYSLISLLFSSKNQKKIDEHIQTYFRVSGFSCGGANRRKMVSKSCFSPFFDCFTDYVFHFFLSNIHQCSFFLCLIYILLLFVSNSMNFVACVVIPMFFRWIFLFLFINFVCKVEIGD